MTRLRCRGRRGRLAVLAVLAVAAAPLVGTPAVGAAEVLPEVQLSGTVVQSFAESSAGTESTGLALATASGVFGLTGSAATTLAPLVGQRVTITTGPRSERFVVDRARLDLAGGRAGALSGATPSATAPRRALVVTAHWQGQSSLLDVYGRPIDGAFVRQELARTREFLLRASSGQLDIDPVVVDQPIRTAISATNCPGYTMADEVTRQLRARGIDPDTFGHLMILLPWSADCYAGWALSPGRVSWYNGMVELNGFAHELGHNLGMPHGREATCTGPDDRPVTLSTSCTSEIARLGQDMMSSGPWTPFGYHRELAGWTTSEEVRTDGTYLLAPLGLRGSAPDVLRVPRADGSFLYLDLRQPAPAVAGPVPDDPPAGQWSRGIAVRLVQSRGPGQPAALLDTTPGSDDGFADATLVPGAVLADAASGIALRNDGYDPAGNARVTLLHRQDWGVPGGVTVAREGTSTLRLAAATGAAVHHFELGETAGPTSVPTSAGSQRVYGSAATVRTLRDGVHWISARAVGPAGTPGPWSAAVQVVTDSTPPTTPARSSALGGPGGCTVRWGAASDRSSGVGRYEVLEDGSVIGRTAAPATSVTVRPRRPAGGGTVWSLTVVAVDRSGNRSSPATAACFDTVAPSAPGRFGASWGTDGAVHVTWRGATDSLGVVTRYEVLQRGDVIAAAPPAATSATLTVRAQSAPTFELQLVAIDRAGNRSRPASVRLTDDRPPPAPRARLVWRADGRLDVRWVRPPETGSGADMYLVRYDGGGLPAPRCCSHTLTSGWARRATVRRVAANRRRLVSVAAVDRAGNLSAWTSLAVGSARTTG